MIVQVRLSQARSLVRLWLLRYPSSNESLLVNTSTGIVNVNGHTSIMAIYRPGSVLDMARMDRENYRVNTELKDTITTS
ncbi:hypothetical protein FIU28_25820 [Tardiphaga sp. vice154]|uniref:hypothetical protein n=1 Tax=Tardiphaga sp. vice154 TaxID=2592814 RepID=UPI00116256D0|nr:hypothetical protein [Tardiphaga sp. vice154]QDM24176.1 hypothetical protein FIU28_25820 [Tardiphaga sp. vice154]